MDKLGLDAVFQSIADAAEAANPRKEGDYEVDGILFCGVCKTPKQTILPTYKDFSWSGRKVPCCCACHENERKKAEEEERRKKTEALRKAAFPSPSLSACTFDSDDDPEDKLSKVSRGYAEHFDEFYDKGKGLLFFGPVGSGKTFYAACIANALIDRGRKVKFTNFAEIARRWRKDAAHEVLYELDRADLLILDDLGAERETEYMGEIVHEVINARSVVHKPLIVTTNLTGAELRRPENLREKRIFSRLYELCLPYEFPEKDRRKLSLKNSFEQLKKLLD